MTFSLTLQTRLLMKAQSNKEKSTKWLNAFEKKGNSNPSVSGKT